MLSYTEIEPFVDYDPKTGIFTWKQTLCSTAVKGTRAGSKAVHGYRRIQINRVPIYEHNAAWILIHGSIPEGFEVDHKDLVKSHNWIDNLRLVTKSQNQHNRGMSKNNTSGVKGVSKCKQTGMWKARVTFHGKEYHVGRFKLLDEAKEAVKLKRNELHGEFANHG